MEKNTLKKTAVVTTTINMPYFLEGVCKNGNFYGWKKNIEFFVIGDKKTPLEASKYCKQLSLKYSYPIHYMGIEEQEKALRDYPNMLGLIPYNDSNRKILGCVIAYLQNFENIITIDDDNYATSHDFFGYHNIAGSEIEVPLIESSTGWFNVGEYLIEENDMPVFHRGFPWSQRKIESPLVTIHETRAKVAVNGGFWTGDPDIDATSRLFWPIRVIDMDPEMAPTFGLYPGTWCPFNNQNTSINREVLPAYYTPPKSKRYSDLFPAFVADCVASHFNHVITYGYPFVKQDRNIHNLWVDVEDEMHGAQGAEILIDLLRTVHLTGKTYHECLGQLNDHFDNNIAETNKLPQRAKDMLINFWDEQKTYYDVFEEIHKNMKGKKTITVTTP